MLSFLTYYRKWIAWSFVIILYLDLLAVPLSAHAEVVRYSTNSFAKYKNSYGSFFKNIPNSGFHAVSSPIVINSNPVKKAEIVVNNKKNEIKAKFGTGPTQPEMQSFQSVNTNNMVDLFTGDFSYNIPLLDVGGYPVNIHYQSGITMDQDASWVGMGWNINPGTITRNMRGLPDDFSGDVDKVSKTVSMKPNRTAGVTLGGDLNVELFGLPIRGIDASLGIFHNNYKGWGIETGINAGINVASGSKGSLTAGLSLSNNSQSGFDIHPSMGFSYGKLMKQSAGQITIGTNMNSRVGIQGLQLHAQVRQHVSSYHMVYSSVGIGVNSFISFASPSYTPTISVPFTSSQFTFKAKLGGVFTGVFTNPYLRGYLSSQKVENEDTTTTIGAYGYLNYEKAAGNTNVLLDFNREKDVPYRNQSPHIAVPIYTYDTYTITGEGNGGMFRPYRGDIGYVYDNAISTKSNSKDLLLEAGFGNINHIGTNVALTYATTKSGPWVSDNFMKDVTGFKSRDSIFENVYLKNPGEKGVVNLNYLDAIGDENLIRVDLSASGNREVVTASRNVSMFKNGQSIGKRTFTNNTLKIQRDKRTQMISYLTANEATLLGLDKKIRSYAINSFPSSSCNGNYTELLRIDAIRKGSHMSEISVLNPDGKRYVYGIPIYNIEQKDVTMAVGAGSGDNSTGLTSYVVNKDNSTQNDKGRDGFFSKEKLPPYSHAFLMTGILSPDYVDITGDGITPDDIGEAVKFNYSEVYGVSNPYQWRAPFEYGKASYNEGLKTDTRDEKGSYSYGTREQWYLNSIESKTMIATFVLDTAKRLDSYGASGENGGIDTMQKLYRLRQINLYSKADFLKNGPENAKPVKTINFEYSYELCQNAPNSKTGNGKLTLKKIWFSYNKNNKGKQNPYIFTYNSQNPGYNHKSYDRWGNYKDPNNNPGGNNASMTNADYPYSLQSGNVSGANSNNKWDSAKASSSVAAWTLSEIKLPSGGKIKVTYESDDYAYVQNKRAMQFYSIVGFTDKPVNGILDKNIYKYISYKSFVDYRYVVVKVSEPVSDINDINRKYLEGVKKLFFKVAVKMPKDIWGSGTETVPVYADIDSVGIYGSPSDSTIIIKIAAYNSSESPIVTAAIQFLRLNLTSKAYPYSEPGDKLTVKTAVGMLKSVSDNIKTTAFGYGTYARSNKLARESNLSQSFVRLNNPNYKKLGGGLRVKRVEIEDYWNVMTSNQMKMTTYGQEYDYTTSITVDGVKKRISSGVASYEPSIGSDENPFHVPSRLYTQNEGILAPTDYVYVEEPFAETFFPSPMVGYSKVSVQTINKTKKSATGYEESEFYTSKDFPTIVEMTVLDGDSKKPYNPKINKWLRFNARNYITLSQGFKVELNDMNGKPKSNSVYAQNDLANPISYTYNYYRLQNDASGQKRLSSNVMTVDSANGVINTDAQIGKEVELMVDVREQVSSSSGGTIDLNVDYFTLTFPFIPPIPFVVPTVIPLPSSEVNRYRSIAVLKVVNKYGLLDSVIHIEKGSRVATRNLLYDGETGDVLLSQTNNEFDDPIYNFTYPAHWAYSGMGLAYKNMGAIFSNLRIHQGRAFYRNGRDTFPVNRYFESGDELLVTGFFNRLPNIPVDSCQSGFYLFTTQLGIKKIWAIEAAKGVEGDNGLYFIDQDGKPVTGQIVQLRVIRSGKRNLASTAVGSISMLRSPIKTVNNIQRLVFDSTSRVVAAGAAKFKDFWKVDSTSFAKDTVIMGKSRVDSGTFFITANSKSYSIYNYKTKKGVRRLYDDEKYKAFEASSYDNGNNKEDFERRSWIAFDFSKIPRGALIKKAELYLSDKAGLPQENRRGVSNSAFLERVKGKWLADLIKSASGDSKQALLDQYFNAKGLGATDISKRLTIPATQVNVSSTEGYTNLSVAGLVQDMLDDYYNKNYDPALLIRLVNAGGDRNGKINRMAYTNAVLTNARSKEELFLPILNIEYYFPCSGSSRPTFSSTPVPGYYCLNAPKDTVVCRPNIVDSAVNPYRWGILGNWRMDRAYTYFDRRNESDPLIATNIRTNGEIKSFMPYWSFTSNYLQQSMDSSRWVWNSEMTLFNKKGYEIENRDPLGRYNSGQYGYNQTLPVSVVQNSKNRSAMFDGFEDYDYTTDTCKKCPAPRFVDLTSGGGVRVDTVSHTGKFSLKLAGNSTATVPIKISSPYADTLTKLSILVDSIQSIDTAIVPIGTGLSGVYRYNLGRNICTQRIDPVINFDWGKGSPAPGCPGDNFEVYWTGYFQPLFTDSYTFYLNSDDGAGMDINVNNSWVTIIDQPGGNFRDDDAPSYVGRPSTVVQLKAGVCYSIRIRLREILERSKIRFLVAGSKETAHIVPQNQMYPATTDTSTLSSTRVTSSRWCVRLQRPRAIKATHMLFSPEQGNKVVFSAWVKEGVACISGSYTNVSVQLNFNSGSPSVFTLVPKGNIIDGWQRIEDTLTMPANASIVSIVFRATSATPVYFDDIRWHPFNSNMKSFVYNPITIRLMAELDENNYATFYEYDDDGTLIRVKKETERGIKTIKETRSALIKE